MLVMSDPPAERTALSWRARNRRRSPGAEPGRVLLLEFPRKACPPGLNGLVYLLMLMLCEEDKGCLITIAQLRRIGTDGTAGVLMAPHSLNLNDEHGGRLLGDGTLLLTRWNLRLRLRSPALLVRIGLLKDNDHSGVVA